jgi:hypothetical protein
MPGRCASDVPRAAGAKSARLKPRRRERSLGRFTFPRRPHEFPWGLAAPTTVGRGLVPRRATAISRHLPPGAAFKASCLNRNEG